MNISYIFMEDKKLFDYCHRNLHRKDESAFDEVYFYILNTVQDVKDAILVIYGKQNFVMNCYVFSWYVLTQVR
jgi:hypothetical protein